MKNFILTLLLILSFSAKSQTFSEVVIDTTLTKSTLYSNALSFFANTFNSANAVIQMKDPETGKVIGKGKIDGKDVTITITCKEGKYKYEIDMILKTEISLPINQLGNLGGSGNSGVTKAPVTVVDGKTTVVKDEVYFVYNNSAWSSYRYVYNSESIVHSPAPMTTKYYQGWKELVDIELLKPEYQNLSSVSDTNLLFLKNKIKTEMSKSDF